jgi:hypothetical protein
MSAAFPDTKTLLANRLEEHAESLARNKSLPWLGLGLHNDLRAAAAVLRGQPMPTITVVKPAGGGTGTGQPKPVMEFDL